MAVYVDEAIWRWRGRRWCHLTADTPEELHAMAARLGVLRQWFQSKPGQPWHDHYDVPDELRAQAVACGARELSTLEMGRRLAQARRATRLAGRSRP